MESINKYGNWRAHIAIWFVLFGCFFGAFQLNRSGDPEFIVEGKIESCETIFGGKGGSVNFAYVKLETGKTVKLFHDSCCKGKTIKVAKKQGVLFFNTIYMSANA